MSDNRLNLLGRDMAVDLGTANTLVYVRGRGIVLNEPSVVAVDVKDGRPLAVGAEAKRMIGRTPSNIQAIRPLKDGVIADFEICEKMLRYFIHRVHQRRFAKPRMVICVPSGITGVEQRAVMEAAEYAGARKAYIIEEPMAAAIGAGLPVHEPTGNMVVDIGGGTTEVAVISLGGIVTSQSVRIGGDELDEAIVSFVKKEFSLALGERTAEEIKIALGSAFPLEEELHAEIRGRDLVTGLPKTVVVSTEEIRHAIDEPVSAIIDAVKVTLDRTPPELAADIMEQGIVLTGGGALLHGLDARLQHETGMPIVVARDPLNCVAVGSGQCLEEFEALKRVLITSTLALTGQQGVRGGEAQAVTPHPGHAVVLVLISVTVITLDESGRTHSLTSGIKSVATDVFSPLRSGVNDILRPDRRLLRRSRALRIAPAGEPQAPGPDRYAPPAGGRDVAPNKNSSSSSTSSSSPTTCRRSRTLPQGRGPDHGRGHIQLRCHHHNRQGAVAKGLPSADPVIAGGGLVGKVVAGQSQHSHRPAGHRRAVQGGCDIRQPATRSPWSTAKGRGSRWR